MADVTCGTYKLNTRFDSAIGDFETNKETIPLESACVIPALFSRRPPYILLFFKLEDLVYILWLTWNQRKGIKFKVNFSRLEKGSITKVLRGILTLAPLAKEIRHDIGIFGFHIFHDFFVLDVRTHPSTRCWRGIHCCKRFRAKWGTNTECFRSISSTPYWSRHKFGDVEFVCERLGT